MPASKGPRPSTKFYQEDVVRLVNPPHTYGIVLRCWHDAEDIAPVSPMDDPLMRPLNQGEVGVSFFPTGIREILPESDFTLVDRSFQPGDYCKRSVDDVRSGVVTSIDVMASLAHAISNVPVQSWVNIKDLEHDVDVDVGQYVLYDDWVGQVTELFDECIVEASGTLVRVPEIASRLSVGDRGHDILTHHLTYRLHMGGGNPFAKTPQPTCNDTVLAVKHTVVAVCWLALNQSLHPAVAQTKQRPNRFWHGEQLSKLSFIPRRSDDIRVGDRVRTKADVTVPVTTHATQNSQEPPIRVRTLSVKETQTKVTVLWQDGEKETLTSIDLIPYLNPDEYDCWPGDHVIWKGEDQKRAAVVQTVNSADRVAKVMFTDTGAIEDTSVLELDPNGNGDWALTNHPHAFGVGVRRCDTVFIHAEGTTNGAAYPTVPRIGEIEAWVKEDLLGADGDLVGWRREMADLGVGLVAHRDSSSGEHNLRKVSKDDKSLTWIGEVVGLRMDGMVEVRHPNSEVEVYPLQRLTKLYDSIDQFEEEDWDDMSEDHESYEEEGPIWTRDENGEWTLHEHADDDDDWEDDEDGAMDVDGSLEGDEPIPPLVPIDTDSADMAVDTPMRQATPSLSDSSPVPAGSSVNSPLLPPADSHANGSANATVNLNDDDEVWQRFAILPSAPPDHAFYGTPTAQPSKAFHPRLNKEYRALTSSLPESIIVRTYEDRSDLLRCLIIGPENTPYEDAPFVIDWMLDANFPHSPPIAHFLSWTNGNGRVNPNLYEEGKVCLSILGTWSGDRNETWSAARSSLLQAFISIQGLVLVKEPWFCEPAYEKLRGTEEGIVNSRLYSEKAYVLSRGFVRRALEVPLGDLEKEIKWLYYTNGRLKKVLSSARALIEKSKTKAEVTEADADLAVPRLTAGGVITLERTLTKLQSIAEAQQ